MFRANERVTTTYIKHFVIEERAGVRMLKRMPYQPTKTMNANASSAFGLIPELENEIGPFQIITVSYYF